MSPRTVAGYAASLVRVGRHLVGREKHELVDPVTRWPKVPMSEEAILEFLAHATAIAGKDKQASFSAVNNYVSAIKYAHTEADVLLPASTTKKISNFLKGYKREVQEKKETGEMSQLEGKSPLTVGAYTYLCMATLQATTDFGLYVFMHAFLILSWALLNRSVSTATINYAHIHYAGDCLFINQPRSKSDQSGERAYARSIFANPGKPEVCPFLAMALQVFSASGFGGQRTENASPLLFGKHGAEQRFSEALAKMMKKNEDLANQLGTARAQDIGTHSIRKGAATYLTGQMEGPSGIAVFQRAGWSLGVQDRYLMSSGEDQYTGRFCSLLNPLEESFACLPPHFKDNRVPFPADHCWATVLPGWTSLPHNFQSVLPVLLASVVFHNDWLRATLPSKHSFFKCPLFSSGLLAHLVDLGVVETGVFENKTTGVRASGVPPSLSARADTSKTLSDLAARVDALSKQVEKSQQTVVNRIDETPAKVSAEILENFSVEGCAPITRANLDSLFTSLRSEIAGLREQWAVGPAPQLAAAASSSISAASAAEEEWYDNYTHSGRSVT